MKSSPIFFTVVLLSLCSACTYTRNTRGLECTMKHYWKGRELHVEAYGRNAGIRPVTIIQNANFCYVDLDAKDEKKRSNLVMASVSWSDASRSSLKTLWHGDSVPWAHKSWTINPIGNGHWRIRDIMGDGFDTTDPVLRASFSVGWYPHSLPWRARFGKVNIFKGDREGEFGESIEIRLE